MKFGIGAVLRTLRGRFGASARLRAEVDVEIRQHLQLRIRDLMAEGLDAKAARAEAERRFGDPEAARRRLYASARRNEERLRLSLWLDSLRLDLRAAGRRIRREPGFSVLSVLTFALGIWLTTTMFAVLDATVLRPLPFPEAEELVALYSVTEQGGEIPWVSSTNWLDWREQSRTLAGTAMYEIDRVSLATEGDNVRVAAAGIGGAFFEVLGAPMRVGRAPTEAELDAREPVIAVSERVWRNHLGGTDQIGDLVVGGVARRVVGVVDAGYAFPEGVDVWLPATYWRQSGAARNNINWQVIARLGAGVEAADARVDLDRIADRIREEAPEAVYSWGVGVVSLKDTIIGDADRTVGLLMGAVVFVLLVACSNLAGQAYARSLGSQSAGAVRLALGATRWRVVQNQVTEHLALALLGGAAGTALAVASVGWVRAGGLPLPRADAVALEPRVLGFALVTSLLAGLAAGLAPAVRVARSAPRAAMGSVRGASTGAQPRAAAWLVCTEIALSMTLLIGGGLLVRGFLEFATRDLGFEPEAILVAEIELDGTEYAEASAREAYWRDLLSEARELPGVAAAALANDVPGVEHSGYGVVRLDDQPNLEGVAATYRVVSEGYLAAIGLPLLAGRDFDGSDASDSERVALVSRAFADAYWPDDEALGKRLRSISMEPMLGSPPMAVVGVVEDIDSGYGREVRPAMYVLHRQVPWWTRRLVLAVTAERGSATPLIAPLRERLRKLDPSLAAETAPMSRHLDAILARDRLVMALLSGFALLTLALAAIGVHGLLSFAVARRTREFAIRTALGAERSDVLRIVVGAALRIAAAGAVAGTVAALWLGGLLQSQVTEVDSRDPLTFVVVGVTLALVTLAAAAMPAWRALRLDPASSLRAD